MKTRRDHTNSAHLAGVVLAAGAGTRLRPLTDLRPKALCPVGGVPLLDHALDQVASLTGQGYDHLTVNAHHHADQVVAHVADRAHLSVERPEALGTAGALGALRGWLGGRDVLLTNADAYLPAGLQLAGGAPFTAGWDGERCRLACAPAGTGRVDFTLPDGTGVRYVGACLLPWRAVRELPATPSGLYEMLWRNAAGRGALDLQLVDGPAVDCGTVADYLRANLLACGGDSVVGHGAIVEGRLTRSVVWDGARVGPREHLVDVVRAADAEGRIMLTVGARP
jgi:MurNAc alpha-1-phosphate uridylyltransferase